MTVGEWLKSIGLSQYEATFRERQIDMDVLPDLTEADLKGLGVALGSRKRMMKAIADFDSTSLPGGSSGSSAASAAAAVERRPLTILFCDFEGSTVAAQLDVEEWRDILAGYVDEASEAVGRFGGSVLQALSDGLMAAFGYHQAQESDAERAVRAALAIQRAIGERNAKSPPYAPKVSARIGIESGKVVVDSLGGVFGLATSVAARVQAAADPGMVLVTANVQREVTGLFLAEDRGDHELKGVPHPVHLYRIVRVSSGRRRTGARTLTPFSGREEELELLTQAWERARSGEGRLVLIVGEPGIGKSRLLKEFQARLGEAPHTWIDWNASQLLQNTPLHPVADWGRLRFDIAKTPTERLAELEALLVQLGLDAQVIAPLVAPLLEIPLPAGRVSTLAPDELRRLQLAAIESWLMAGARLQPVILAFEDLQWSDPTSLDALARFAESGAQAPLYILATARPEFKPAWSAREHHVRIALAPLDPANVRRMVGALAPQRALSEEIIEGVSERTGGVPLFVEEVTRLLLERGEQVGVQAIPPTLQQSLAARLDRLGPAREVAEIGAVLGREFSYALLRDVSGLPETMLKASLARLVDAGILFVDGAPPEASYRFKHSLIQDEAYENLLISHRQALHLRAAEALGDSGGAQASSQPEAIAHHLTEAGRADLAIEWWSKAGHQALRRSAFREAVSHLGKAIELADASTQASAQDQTVAATASRSLQLQSDYAQAVMWSRGFGAEDAKAAFARAREFAMRTGDPTERFKECVGRWVRSYVRGELGSARETAEAFLRDAENEGRPTAAGAARRVLGLTCLFQGDFVSARSHLERTLTDYDPERDAESRFHFSVDTGACASAYLALACWHLGDFARVGPLMDRAVSHALERGHIPTVVNVHAFKTILEARRGDPATALGSVEAQLRLSREHGMALYVAFGEMYATWARSRLADAGLAAGAFRPILANYLSQGNRADAPYFYGILAGLEAASGESAGALARIDEGLRLADETGEHWSDPELHRIRGDILLTLDPKSGAAENAFQTAIAVARRQETSSFGLRAVLALAKLQQRCGRVSEARTVLRESLERFSATREMPEIAQAEALMAELGEAFVN